MSLYQCPISELCPKYESGSEDKGHFTRVTTPCLHFLAFACETGNHLQMFISDTPIACNIEKMSRIKEELHARS